MRQRKTSLGFREFLQNELANRCSENTSYSLRAFARSLSIDHSSLSQILRGKRKLTKTSIHRLGEEIGLEQGRIDDFLAAEERDSEYRTHRRNEKQMRCEAVEVLSQWQHYAILELTRLKSFRPDSRWISRMLGISTDEVNIAITRLLDLGLLHMVDRKTWVASVRVATADLTELPRQIVSSMVREWDDRSSTALSKRREEDQIHSHSTLAVRSNRVREAMRLISRFQLELNALFDSNETQGNELYQLQISFFPLTHSTKKQEQSHGSTGDAISDSLEESR